MKKYVSLEASATLSKEFNLNQIIVQLQKESEKMFKLILLKS